MSWSSTALSQRTISAISPSRTRCGCGARSTRASSTAPASPRKPRRCSARPRRAPRRNKRRNPLPHCGRGRHSWASSTARLRSSPARHAVWGALVRVANAGGGRGRPVDTKASGLDPALLQLVLAMNLFGTVYSCNGVAPIMKEQRSGRIITVSSVAGTAPSKDGGYAHYGAAKAAIAHYTRYLAQDLGPYGITANCIAPGGLNDRY